jgi:hypothetical protein
MTTRPKVTFRYSRLTFRRDLIEPLEPTNIFRIETPAGAFEMSKSDFHETFPNVIGSPSYAIKGIYNYTKTPKKAERFLVEEQPWKVHGRYAMPRTLRGVCTDASYKKWLHRKAVAHVRRDRKRWNITLSTSDYKKTIHAAVLESGRYDAYTSELLDWELISKYDNAKSKRGGAAYKKTFAMLPTVDHVGDVPGDLNFRICSWRTNSVKSDLTLKELIEVCRKVLQHNPN